MNKKVRYALLGLVVLLLGIQLVPVDRSNPPATAALEAPPEVQAILQDACYDCHSNQTVWPAYSYVAPISWWVADHVDEGRMELNFSEWHAMTEKRRRHKLKEIWEEVEEGEMPLRSYLWMHGEARLTQTQQQVLRDWVYSHDLTEENGEHEAYGDEH